MATAAFGVLMVTLPPTSQASLGSSQHESCLKAGRSLGLWFKAEARRRARVSVDARDGFNAMLAGFKAAQSQCEMGLADEALANIQALESQIARLEERRQPPDPFPPAVDQLGP